MQFSARAGCTGHSDEPKAIHKAAKAAMRIRSHLHGVKAPSQKTETRAGNGVQKYIEKERTKGMVGYVK